MLGLENPVKVYFIYFISFFYFILFFISFFKVIFTCMKVDRYMSGTWIFLAGDAGRPV